MTILGFTSTRSSGRAYTLAPIFRAIEMAYLPGRREEGCDEETAQRRSCSRSTVIYGCVLLVTQSSALTFVARAGPCHHPRLWADLGSIKPLLHQDLLWSPPRHRSSSGISLAPAAFDAGPVGILSGCTGAGKAIPRGRRCAGKCSQATATKTQLRGRTKGKCVRNTLT